VLEHVDGFFEAVHHEPVCVEPVLAEPVEHCGTLIKRRFPAAEDAAASTGLIALFDHRDAEPFFGEQARRS